MKSEKLDLLATALSKAQSEMPAVPMRSVNPFLKNHYADLATMIEVASPVLTRNGLSISQQPVSLDGQVGVTTTLLHASGQWIEDTISLPLGDEKGKSLAQVTGSIITYLRRYSFGAICGLATDEDTDGNAPVKNHEQPKVAYQAKPDNGNGSSGNQAMTYEQACNMKSSDKTLYGNCTNAELEGKKIGILKALKGDVDAVKQSQYQNKLDAIKVLLAVPEPERMKRAGQIELTDTAIESMGLDA
jgi:hypothetical protein